MMEYNEFDALLGALDDLDPVATCAAVALLGPSARVSHQFGLDGFRLDGTPDAHEPWFDDDQVEGPLFDEEGDDE